jgi:hypothetical protein
MYYFHPGSHKNTLMIDPALQDEFMATLKTVITKKQKVMVELDEGWYSENEMKNDLGWNQ